MKSFTKIVLISIIVLAAAARLIFLDTLPKSPHADEVMNAYVGRYILQNGFDLYGNPWPLIYFDNFGDYPNIMPMYLSGIFTILFGNTMWAVRLPIALLGIAAVYLVYLISKNLFRQQGLALFSALSLAIMPWHIVLSRSTAEGIVASTVFLLGLYILIQYFYQPQLRKLALAFCLLAFTYLLYPSYRIMIPLVFLISIFVPLLKKQRIQLVVVTALAFFLTLVVSQTNWGQGRFNQTSITGSKSVVFAWQSSFIAGEGHTNAVKARIFFNKPVMIGREFVKQYISYFSPNYLFSEGGLPKRYLVPEQGLWYYGYLLIFLAGSGFLLFNTNKAGKLKQQLFIAPLQWRTYLFIGLILFCAPVAAALTYDDVPNIHRTVLMAPMLAILVALPLHFIKQIRFRKFNFVVILMTIIAFESIYFWNKYTVHSDAAQLLHRGPAVSELIEYISLEKNNYDQIFVPKEDELALFYLFHNQIYNPELSGRMKKSLEIDQIGNVFFIPTVCDYEDGFFDQSRGKKNLIIQKKECNLGVDEVELKQAGLQEIAQIRDIRGNLVYIIYLWTVSS